MKNLIFGFIALITITTESHAFKVEIQDLAGEYISPKGSASAKKFILEGFDFLLFDAEKKPVEISFEKINQSIDIKFEGQSYLWQDPPKILLEANSVKLESINAKTYRQVIQSSAKKMEFNSKKDYFRLDRFTLFCQNPGRTAPEPSDFVINACTTQAKINIQALRYQDKTGENILTKLLQKIIPESENETNDLNINSLNIKVNKHQFTFVTSAAYKIRTKISAKGATWYDMKTKILKIRLDQVKVSFFNITGKVFSELAKNQNENLTVKRPYIYIKQ